MARVPEIPKNFVTNPIWTQDLRKLISGWQGSPPTFQNGLHNPLPPLRTDPSMDARLIKTALILTTFSSLGATHRTPNFVVDAPTAEIAEQAAITAERCREEIAIDWLGKPLPRWYKPCPIKVKVGQIGAGGATTFSFDRGEVFGWKMTVQGTVERILDSVIPHEVSHTIFACHFRRPLPRWADEGAATLVEHESEQRRQRLLLKQVMQSNRRIPLRDLLGMKEYPRDMQNVLALYAEGYSLADFLVQAGGKVRYLQFLDDAHHHGWPAALQQHYSLEGVDDLEGRWDKWLIAGSPRLPQPEGQLLAAARPGPTKPPVPEPRQLLASNGPSANMPRPTGPTPIVRSQSPEPQSVGPSNQQRHENTNWNAISGPRRPRPAPLGQRQTGMPHVRRQVADTQARSGEQKFSTDESLNGSRFPHRRPSGDSGP